jgi:16S rRNA (guanine966-N2)-methyltransferase
VRIIAGERRGARLAVPRGAATRPTSDRTRESIFSLLGDVSGLDVLDPFAGSGALGLEALSRGASHVVFCETSQAALRALRDNVERLGYGERATVLRGDGRRRMAADAAAERRYHLLLLDPPYRMLPALQAPFSLHLPRLLHEGGLAVVESAGAQEPLDLPLELDTTRVYGETRVSVYRHA